MSEDLNSQALFKVGPQKKVGADGCKSAFENIILAFDCEVNGHRMLGGPWQESLYRWMIKLRGEEQCG